MPIPGIDLNEQQLHQLAAAGKKVLGVDALTPGKLHPIYIDYTPNMQGVLVDHAFWDWDKIGQMSLRWRDRYNRAFEWLKHHNYLTDKHEFRVDIQTGFGVIWDNQACSPTESVTILQIFPGREIVTTGGGTQAVGNRQGHPKDPNKTQEPATGGAGTGIAKVQSPTLLHAPGQPAGTGTGAGGGFGSSNSRTESTHTSDLDPRLDPGGVYASGAAGHEYRPKSMNDWGCSWGQKRLSHNPPPGPGGPGGDPNQPGGPNNGNAGSTGFWERVKYPMLGANIQREGKAPTGRELNFLKGY